MSTIVKEKRMDMRYQFSYPVVYTCDEEITIYGYGTTFDLSSSGMSFYTDKSLRKGLNLQVKIQHVWNKESITAVVKWTSMKTPQFFRVGVAYI
jgi:hypothetical protein